MQAGRKIQIDYYLTGDEVKYIITDQGEGFDQSNIEESFFQKANEKMLAHGRGLIIAREVFDEMKFNQKGNQVSLLKFFNKER